jgi:acyl-CoA thioesterase FadM
MKPKPKPKPKSHQPQAAPASMAHEFAHTTLFLKSMPVRFHDLDMAGIAFFANVYSWSHDIYEDFVQEALGYNWRTWFNNSKWIVPIRKSECLHVSPIRAGLGKIDISVLVEKIGDSSLELRYIFSAPSETAIDDRPAKATANRVKIKSSAEKLSPSKQLAQSQPSALVLAEVKLTHVFVDRSKLKKISIPDDIRKRLLAYQSKCLNRK